MLDKWHSFLLPHSPEPLYINVAEQPARLRLDDKTLLAQWKPSYERGFAMQASIAVVSGVLGLIAAWFMWGWRWIIGISNENANSTSRTMIESWGRLHAVRTGLGMAATLGYLWALN